MFTATEAVPVAKVVAGNKRYPGVVALDNVNFTLNKGEVRALLGKNGAGKSTLIRMLTGSERPDSGDIWIGETRLEGDEYAFDFFCLEPMSHAPDDHHRPEGGDLIALAPGESTTSEMSLRVEWL
ncbi:putative ABC transporter ATP-binding protein [Escherichia coli]|nr:hypothetical protein BHF44_02080 [Escherichia coli]OEN77336.1 hypothetical protein BHF53_15420 [Escherichia coli]CTR85286.1 putative ABC transporter ATP-binding protein [Escherichia coli]CTS35486.1 putative ABC transporter ATP-binding protein [Escherichia coli]CTU47698.1 putative ABC transporter ATP-binding protein [Escherichia coli]